MRGRFSTELALELVKNVVERALLRQNEYVFFLSVISFRICFTLFFSPFTFLRRVLSSVRIIILLY